MLRRASLIDQLTRSLVPTTYVCDSCLSKFALGSRAINLPKKVANPRFRNSKFTFLPLHQLSLRRYASTISSVTAVNVPRSTPPAFRKVERALAALEKDAAVYVDISQLRLALRGLESEDSITRIAILGVGEKRGAARLARALLADPLASETLWEKELLDSESIDGKAVLLKYGEKFGVDNSHPLIKTLSLPASILQVQDLEILVQEVSAIDGRTDINSLLVPRLEAQDSSTGRMTMMTYPVHKVLVYADGLETLPTIGDTQYMGSMIQRVVDGSWSALRPGRDQTPSIIPVNLNLSEVAIETFRTSLERSFEFEHAWFDSNMPSVASWLSEGTSVSEKTPKLSLRRLIELITTTALQAVHHEENIKLQESKAKEVTMATRDILVQGVSVWAENAHTELRDRLNDAFNSNSWSKTKWWKLFWRVDEVGFVTSDILNKAWLVDAEKEMIWISGQIQQSGLLRQTRPQQSSQASTAEDAKTGLVSGPQMPMVADLLDDVKPFEPDEEEPLVERPWPQNISYARSALSRSTIPPLQALSQKLTLQTLSVTFLTSTLSALVYVGVSSTSLYEAGTIAALGLVFSLRRLQTQWETARSRWKLAVSEDGRQVLKREEQLLRETVRRGGEVQFDVAAVEQRRIASEALAKVQEALDEVNSHRARS